MRSITDSLSALTSEERQQLQLGWSPPRQQPQQAPVLGRGSASAVESAAGDGHRSPDLVAPPKLHLSHSADEAVLQHVRAAGASALQTRDQHQGVTKLAGDATTGPARKAQQPSSSINAGAVGEAASDQQPVKDQGAAVLAPDGSHFLPGSPRGWDSIWTPAAAAAVGGSHLSGARSPPGGQYLAGLPASLGSSPVARRNSSFMAPTPRLASDIEVALQALHMAHSLQRGGDELLGGGASEEQEQLDSWQQQVQQPLGTCAEAGGSKSSWGTCSTRSSGIDAIMLQGRATDPSSMGAAAAGSAGPSSHSSVGSRYSSATSAHGSGGEDSHTAGAGMATGAGEEGGLAAVAAELRRHMVQAGIRQDTLTAGQAM
jgi:hypothetical protein